MTLRIERLFWKDDSKNWILFEKMTQRIEYFLKRWLKELNTFLKIWLKELNSFLKIWLIFEKKKRLIEIETFFSTWLKEIEPIFLVWLKEYVYFRKYLTQRINWSFLKNIKELNFFLNTSQRIVLFFPIWFKELNAFLVWFEEFFTFSKYMSRINGSFLENMTQRIEPFLSMTQRIDFFFLEKWPIELDLFHEPFFNMIQRIERFFVNMTQRIVLFFPIWFKELNAFLVWFEEFFTFSKYMSRINGSFLENMTQRIEPFLSMTQRIDFFFWKNDP